MPNVCAAIMVGGFCGKTSNHLESETKGVWKTKAEKRALVTAVHAASPTPQHPRSSLNTWFYAERNADPQRRAEPRPARTAPLLGDGVRSRIGP